MSDCKSVDRMAFGDWEKCSDPTAGDSVVVARSIVSDRVEYSINGAPGQPVPAELLDQHPTRAAMELLTRHIKEQRR